ncbi:Nuclear pore complex protein Nup98-Nup96 [Thoreauomyces humboldtii]|nr:Nuclear pore complex protein Nup98-Nup96 [Thoreauomyces humboldtii]
MFGSFAGGFGQQQQRPPATGFGATGFGQPQQQQQQQGFGGGFGQPQAQPTGFGAQPAATGFGQQPTAFGGGAATGFGAATGGFGGAASTFGGGQTGTMFGSQAATAAPSTGFGGFGMGIPGASAAPAATGFGSALGGGFGAKPAATGFGTFGAAAAPTTAFGGGSTFGAAPAATGFGGQSTGMFGGAGAGAATNDQVNNGTGSPPFQPSVEQETGQNNLVVKNLLQTCSAAIAYKNWSLEELRWQDYQMNKKTGGAGAAAGMGGFGSSFGTSTAGSTFGGGLGGGFGAPATTQQGSLFGAAAPAFGQPQQQQQSSFGFGQTAVTQAAAPSMFGQPSTGFGQTSAPPFGQQTQAATGFGGFGQPQAPKPAFGFGAAAPATSAPGFGAQSTFGQPAAGGSLFGQPAASGGFGFPATTAAAPTGFGQPAATSGFGGFSAAPAAGGLFGAKPAAPTFGTGFGQPATSAPAMFGQPAAAGGSLFGGASSAAPGMFGAPAAAPSMFGTATGFGQPAATTGFGAPKPAFGFGGQSAAPAASGGMFGQAAAPSLFGPAQPQQQPGAFSLGGGSLGGGGLLGGGGVTTAPLGFNNSLGASQSPANLRASIDRNPYGVNPIFDTPAKKQEAALYPAPQEKQKLPMSPYIKVTAREASKIKLRGFSPPRMAKSPQISGGSRYESAIGKSKDDGTVGLDPRFTPRKNVRRLIIDDVTENDSSSQSNAKGKTPKKGVTFAELGGETAQNYDDASSQVSDYNDYRRFPSPGPDSFDHENGGRSGSPSLGSIGPGTPTPQSRVQQAARTPPRSPGPSAGQFSEYVLSPSLETLLRMESDELRNVRNFKISIPGIGSIEWLEPVDLLEASPTKNRTGLDQIAGKVVTLTPKLANVYPDEATKPPVGMGLNVRAEVRLEKCWPVDKSTREAVTDPTDPRYDKHLKKLEKFPDTEFGGFHNGTGTWKFIVQHFSKYGLDDDDDDDPDPLPATPQTTASGRTTSPTTPTSRKTLKNDDVNPFFEPAQVGSVQGQTDLGDSGSDSGADDSSSSPPRRGYGLDDDEEDDEANIQSRTPASSGKQKTTRSPNSGVKRGVVGSRRWVDLGKAWARDDDDTVDSNDEDQEEDQFVEMEVDDSVDTTPAITPRQSLQSSPTKDVESSRDQENITPDSSPRKPPTAQQLEVAHGVQRMKSSLFASSIRPPQGLAPQPRLHKAVSFNLPTESPTSENVLTSLLQTPRTRESTPSKRHQEDTGFADEVGEPSQPQPRAGFGFNRNSGLDASSSRSEHVVPTSPKKYFRTAIKTLPPLESSVTFGHEKVFSDQGLMMGRCCRVGWGPGGKMVVAGGSFAGQKGFSNVNVYQVNVFGELNDETLAIEKTRHQKMLETALANANISKTHSAADAVSLDGGVDGDSTPRMTIVPQASLVSKLNFSEFAAVANKASSSNSSDPVFGHSEEATWKLAAALWDPLPSIEVDDNLSGLLEQSQRREEVSRWLQDAVRELVVAEASTRTGSKEIFSLLTGRQISKAASTALANDDYRLATMIAQLGGAGSHMQGGNGVSAHGIRAGDGTDSPVAQMVTHLIETWTREGTPIPEDALRLWQLIGGTVSSWGVGMFQPITDWKRTFGLFFWYGSAGADTVQDALSYYSQGFKATLNIAPPRPFYLQNKVQTQQEEDFEDCHDDAPKDICFHLLKLFSEGNHLLETALEPLNITAQKLDHRVSWLLWTILSTVKHVRSPADSRLEHIRMRQQTYGSQDDLSSIVVRSGSTSDRLTRDMMWQLETIGLWQWSIFVALFLGRKDARERAVREILARWYPLEDDSDSWITRTGTNAVDTDDMEMDGEDGGRQPVSDLWRFLVEQLEVPPVWIHQARVLAAKYAGDPVQEAVSLIDAKEYVAAHRLIMSEIAPEDIINEHYVELEMLLKQIPPTAIEAQNWTHGGKLVLKYITIMERTPFLIRQARDYASGYSLTTNASSVLLGRSVNGHNNKRRDVNNNNKRRDGDVDVDDSFDATGITQTQLDGAEANRVHARRELETTWVPILQGTLRDLAHAPGKKTPATARTTATTAAKRTAQYASARSRDDDVEGPSSSSSLVASVYRSEMAGRVVALLCDCEKVLRGDDDHHDRGGGHGEDEGGGHGAAAPADACLVDPTLLARLPLVPGSRVTMLQRIRTATTDVTETSKRGRGRGFGVEDEDGDGDGDGMEEMIVS